MQSLMIVSVLGPQSPSSANDLVTLIADCNCNVLDSRTSLLAGEFCGTFMVVGTWSALAKFEHALPILANKLQLQATLKRVEQRENTENAIPYSVLIVAHDAPGLLREITQFFLEQNMTVQEMYSNVYASPHTGSATLVLNLTIHVAQSINIALLREQFHMMCDELNVDAVLEPIKF